LGFAVQPETISTPDRISEPRMPIWAAAGAAVTTAAIAAIAAAKWTDARRIGFPLLPRAPYLGGNYSKGVAGGHSAWRTIRTSGTRPCRGARMDDLVRIFAARGDLAHLALLLWALAASALAWFALRELTASMRRFDDFVRELARFNNRFNRPTKGRD
jgi:hypothetical protein